MQSAEIVRANGDLLSEGKPRLNRGIYAPSLAKIPDPRMARPFGDIAIAIEVEMRRRSEERRESFEQEVVDEIYDR